MTMEQQASIEDGCPENNMVIFLEVAMLVLEGEVTVGRDAIDCGPQGF